MRYKSLTKTFSNKILHIDGESLQQSPLKTSLTLQGEALPPALPRYEQESILRPGRGNDAHGKVTNEASELDGRWRSGRT